MSKLIAPLDTQFKRLYEHSRALVEAVPVEKLYWRPRQSSGAFLVYSCGEYILRSAAAVEQTFDGITTNLWDDPFEWALPEYLDTPVLLTEYLSEVESTRQRGFSLLRTDEDLGKKIYLPSGEVCYLVALLIETLVRSVHYQGRAFATFRLVSDAPLPQI